GASGWRNRSAVIHRIWKSVLDLEHSAADRRVAAPDLRVRDLSVRRLAPAGLGRLARPGGARLTAQPRCESGRSTESLRRINATVASSPGRVESDRSPSIAVPGRPARARSDAPDDVVRGANSDPRRQPRIWEGEDHRDYRSVRLRKVHLDPLSESDARGHAWRSRRRKGAAGR